MGIPYYLCNSSVKYLKKKKKFSKRSAERKWRAKDPKVEGVGLGPCISGCAILHKLLYPTKSLFPHE